MAPQKGELEKLKIQAYKDDTFSDEAGAPFEAMINPETFSHEHGIDYTQVKKLGSNVQISDFDKMAKEKVSFKIVLDNTGVVPLSENNKGKDVQKMIKELKDTVYDYQGSIHQPYFTEILWGSIIFKGRLEKISLEYKLFRSDGTPLRANASLSFVGYLGGEMADAKAKNSSPDMTHIVTIKEGDTLVGLCRNIYGMSNFYLQVAEHNELTNFRYLVPGSKLTFPPLK